MEKARKASTKFSETAQNLLVYVTYEVGESSKLLPNIWVDYNQYSQLVYCLRNYYG
jgi:hypothetical protein